MEPSRRIQEQQLANTYMTNLRVTSDVGQTLPNGWYVEAHKPTVIKVYGHQVPLVLEQVRTDQERQWLKDAEVEFKIRLEKHKEGISDPKLREKAEQTYPGSVQGIAHQMHSDLAIHPLLKVEQEHSCDKCEDVYYPTNGEGCPKCSTKGEPVMLPPPKQIEQYNQTNTVLDRINTETLPKVIDMISKALMPILVETIKHTANEAVEKALEDQTKPGGKSGRK